MVDGKLVEDPEDEVETPEDDKETGNKACCGCFSSTEEEDTEPVLISFTVRNETITKTRYDPADEVSHREDEVILDNLPEAAAAAGFLNVDREGKRPETNIEPHVGPDG